MRRGGRLGNAAGARGILLFVLAAAAAAQELPPREQGALANLARALARKGRADEAFEIQALLSEAGAPEALRRKLAEDCRNALAHAKAPADRVPEVAHELRRIAARLAGTLRDDPVLAARILRLDGTVAAAHRVLGRVEHEGRFVPAGMPALLARRAEIADALLRARRLPVELESAPSPLEVMRQVYGRPGVQVSAHGVRVHSVEVPEEKLRRIVQTLLRAGAVSHWIRTGRLEIVPTRRTLEFAFTGTVPMYTRWVAAVDLTEEQAQNAREMVCFWDRKHVETYRPCMEAELESNCLDTLVRAQIREAHGGEAQPALYAGHLHWLCLSFLGVPMPSMAYYDVRERLNEERRTHAAAKMTVERERMLRLSAAGLRGLRSWMAYLARRNEDPRWSAAFEDQIGKIKGDDLLKATTVAEFLQERGDFTAILDKTLRATGDRAQLAEAFAGAVGEPLPEFERRWREWLLPSEAGLAERLEGPRAAVDPRHAALTGHLDRLRATAVPSNVRDELQALAVDEELSRGALRHAIYLAKNPDQQQSWPEAHEEFPDRPGFSTEGSWAGQHSVIAFGEKDPVEAVDGWLGTFYHRLPLLDPGLLRIGWALEKGIAVLDAGSLAGPFVFKTYATWPARGQVDVPRSFVPEIPNPVPGQDQGAWGYPITLQCFGFEPEFAVEMRLFEGPAEVDCHFSTPDRPTNPELAPKGTFCLIPRRTLRAATEYEVRTRDPLGGGPLRWTFRTGP